MGSDSTPSELVHILVEYGLRGKEPFSEKTPDFREKFIGERFRHVINSTWMLLKVPGNPKPSEKDVAEQFMMNEQDVVTIVNALHKPFAKNILYLVTLAEALKLHPADLTNRIFSWRRSKYIS